MGNVVSVKIGVELPSIRRERKNARPYAMGTVALKTVTVNHDSLTGEWLYEFEEIRELGADASDKLTELVFEPMFGFGEVVIPDETDDNGEEIVMFVSVTGNTYRAAYVCGTSVYVG